MKPDSEIDETLAAAELESLGCIVTTGKDGHVAVTRGGMQAVVRAGGGGVVEVLYEHALHEATRERCSPREAAALLRAIFARSRLERIERKPG